MSSQAVLDGIGADIGRMADAIQDARKDELLIDFSRLICPHFAAMVEHQTALEGNAVQAHNNKTIFLEAADVWCRTHFSRADRRAGRAGTVRTARGLIERVMEPVYAAMELDDPSRFRGAFQEAPVYAGTYVDALCTELGLLACLEIQPVALRFGIENGAARHVWGIVRADGRWYDTDISEPGFKLGDHLKFKEYEEVEVPL